MAGSKQRFTVEEVVQALKDSDGLAYLAARKLGCHANTVFNYKKRYAAVAEAMEQLRGEMLDEGEQSLLKAVRDGEGWAVCFLLKTQGKQRGYVERQEITGADSKPIHLQVDRGLIEDVLPEIKKAADWVPDGASPPTAG